ncbi:hypothetical protein ACP70R_014526 [Stipagrostis hirtigluma subsp. patula]
MSSPTTKPPPPPPPPRKTFTMNVDSYSESKKLANGRSIMSDVLQAGGHLWRIVYYPNGRLPGATGSMSLFLQLYDAGEAADGDVHVEFMFKLHKVGAELPRFTSAKVAGAFGCRRSALGFDGFVSREKLEKSGLLQHDGFTIACDLTVLPNGHGKPTFKTPGLPDQAPVAAPPRSAPPEPSAPPESRAPPPSPPPEPPAVRGVSGLHADLGRLLATKEGADVDFEVSGKVFAAHKLVLAARSPVFKADFFGPMKEESTSYIRICDMHPDAFEALLHYIYTDSLPDTTTTTNAPGEEAALAQDLLVAAGRYDLKDLKSATEKKLCNHIGVSTVLPMLALAERQQCRKLKKKCLEFVASSKNTRAVMATDDVEHLARNCPSAVKEMITKIVDARDATPSNPLIISVDPSFFFYALIFGLPFALWALLCVLLWK